MFDSKSCGIPAFSRPLVVQVSGLFPRFRIPKLLRETRHRIIRIHVEPAFLNSYMYRPCATNAALSALCGPVATRQEFDPLIPL